MVGCRPWRTNAQDRMETTKTILRQKFEKVMERRAMVARARARMAARVEKAKAKGHAGNAGPLTTISAIAQKVEKAKALSSRPHGRPGGPPRLGLLLPLRSGGHGFPGREKEAREREKAAKAAEREKVEKARCRWTQTMATWATATTTLIIRRMVEIWACWRQLLQQRRLAPNDNLRRGRLP